MLHKRPADCECGGDRIIVRCKGGRDEEVCLSCGKRSKDLKCGGEAPAEYICVICGWAGGYHPEPARCLDKETLSGQEVERDQA